MMMIRIYALIVKEILAVWGDPKSRFILIIAPLIQLALFSFAATLEVRNVSMGVLSHDHGHYAQQLVTRFTGSGFFTKVVTVDNQQEAKQLIDQQKVLFVLSFDQDFSRNIHAGKPAVLQMSLDGRRSNAAQISLGYAAGIVQDFSHDILHRQGIVMNTPEIITRHWFNPNLNNLWYTLTGLVAIIAMVICLIVTALVVARERELGTFDQLLITPLRPVEIIIGKCVPGMLLGTFEGILMIVASVFLYGLPLKGSLLLLFGSLFFFLLAIVGIGLFISSLAQTQQQATLGVALFMSPGTLLSGFATPIANMPDWLQVITYINPLRYFLVISKGIFLKDMTFWQVFHNTWPLALIALFTLSASTWLFRSRMG
jgi:ABC-2 type transport system permease protein